MTNFISILYYIINGDFMQRFKPKRRLKKNVLLKMLLIIIFILLAFKFIQNLMINHSTYIIKTISADKNYSFDKEKSNIFSKVYEYAKENIVNKPDTMLVGAIEYKDQKLPNESMKDTKQVGIENDIQNQTEQANDNPLIYIYSSHQRESYNKEYMEDYNVNPDVFLASHIMQEKLNNMKIKTIVMEDDITAYLNNNNLNYRKSYVASRSYLEPAIKKYPTVKLFIDLHRDSASKEVTTVTIDDKDYAKVMFVIGKEYDTYQDNLAVATKINDKIEAKYPALSRGIMQKEGPLVNGVYNQDLDSRVILIELGGDKNNLNEVLNTIDVLVNILGEYVNET